MSTAKAAPEFTFSRYWMRMDTPQADTQTRQRCLMPSSLQLSTSVQALGVPELEDHGCEKDKLPVNPKLVQDLLFQLNPFIGMVHRALWNSSKSTQKSWWMSAGGLWMSFELPWESGEIPLDWKLTNIFPVFWKGKRDDPVTFQCLVKYGEHYSESYGKIPEGQHRHQSQPVQVHEGKALLKKLNFTLSLNFLQGQGDSSSWSRETLIQNLEFSKAFNTVSPRILLDRTSSTQLDKYVMWWVGNRLMGQVIVNGVTAHWCPVTSGGLQCSILRPVLFKSS